MRFGSNRRAMPEINLTSLIDILFIVLFFLVLTTTFKESTSLRLSLPEAVTGKAERDPARKAISIAVDWSEQIYLEDRPVGLEQLSRLLDAVPARDRNEVLLAADARASHGRVISVIDRVRNAGIYRLRIETSAPEEP